ncbi:cytochrome b5 reductase 4-like isoform X2 [Tubulanus polymorphus]
MTSNKMTQSLSPPQMNLLPPTTGSATGNPRNKVQLAPGHSMMDWIRLGMKSGASLNGCNGRKFTVTSDELSKHNHRTDAWTCINGYVYNITPYMEFHPGGVDELMRAAGTDGTDLFNQIHKWVNAESMLSKCLIGKIESPSVKSLKSFDSKKLSLPLPLPPKFGPDKPRFEWIQNDQIISVIIYTKYKNIRQDNITIIRNDGNLKVSILMDDYIYNLIINLEKPVQSNYEVKVGKMSGKVEIMLNKETAGERWNSVGVIENEIFTKTQDTEISYYELILDKVSAVTHDTYLYSLLVPDCSQIRVPIGYHVYMKTFNRDIEIIRPYTVVLPSILPSDQPSHDECGKKIFLMIKIYSDGALTSTLKNINEGDRVCVSLPEGNFNESKLDDCENIVLIAAGTGFTPMIRIIYKLLIESTQPKLRNLTLTFFNKTSSDILWKEQLEELEKMHEKFRVINVLSRADSAWTGLTGRISKQYLTDLFNESGFSNSNTYVCVCGPSQFTDITIRILQELGFDKKSVHAFLSSTDSQA